MTVSNMLIEEKYFEHTRLPLMKRDGSTPMGIIHLTDVAESMRRPVALVKTSDSVAFALDKAAELGTDVAGLLDENGHFAGLVTSEDLMDRFAREPPPDASVPSSAAG